MTTYTSPPLDAKGLAARNGLSWNGHKWGNNSGQTWNTKVPYAVGLSSDPPALRFELHDTTNDHGLNDPSTKRRAEIGSADTFRNGNHYWSAFSFMAGGGSGTIAGYSTRVCQCHWPSGASPAWGLSIVAANGKPALRVSRKTDSSGNITAATVPLALDVPHDIVVEHQLGANGLLNVWLDGEQIAHYVGQVGSTKEDGYSFRFGIYGVIKGLKPTLIVCNIAAFPATAILADRLTNPPAWIA